MRRLLFALLCWVLVIAPASASILLLGAGSGAGGAPAPPTGNCAESTAFFARSGTMAAPSLTAYDTMICGLVSDATWSKLDVLRIYAAPTTAIAALNLVSSSYNATINGSPTFTANLGFTGVDASTTTYLDSGFNPTTAPSAKFVQNSAHVAIWQTTSVVNANPFWGASNGSTIAAWVLRSSADNFNYIRINGSATSGGSAGTATTTDGQVIASRTANNIVGLYKNGIFVANTGVYNSAGVSNLNFYELGHNASGTAQGSAPAQMAVHWGSGLSAAESFSVYNRVRTYLIAIAGISGWQTAYTQNLISNNTGWNGRTLRNVMAATNTYNGTQVRVTLSPSSGATMTIDAAYMGHAAVAGDAYDFDGTQVQITFNGGSTGFVAAINTPQVSDAMTYTYDRTKNFIISVHFSAVSATRSANNAPGYYKDAVNEAGTTDVTGYTTTQTIMVSKVEVQ